MRIDDAEGRGYGESSDFRSWIEDFGLGEYQLCFLRNKEKQEVDFLVTKNAIVVASAADWLAGLN